MHPVFRGVGVVRDLHRRLSLDPAGRPAEAAGDDGAPPGWGALSRTTDCANVWSFANQIELECRAGSAGMSAEWHFLVTLNERLRPLRDPVEIQSVVVQLIGEHLQASRVHYAQIYGDEFVITR